MATIAKNRIVRQGSLIPVFANAQPLVSSAISWNQGDLLYLDTVNHLLKPVTADADGATFAGIAQQTLVSGRPRPVYQGTAVDAAAAIEAIAGPQHGCDALMKLKSGDVFVAGGLVYATAVDAQTVSSAGTNAIGVFVDAGLTAVAGSQGVVRLSQKVAALEL